MHPGPFLWCGCLAVAIQAADPAVDAKAELLLQAAEYQQIRWISVEATGYEPKDMKGLLRGLPPEQVGGIRSRNTFVVDLVDKRYRFEVHEAKATGDAARPIAWVPVSIEVGSAHRLEHLNYATGYLRIQWDSEKKPNPGLFDRSFVTSLLVKPWEFLRAKTSGSAPCNRNSVLGMLDGSALKEFLADPRLVLAQKTIPETYVYSYEPGEYPGEDRANMVEWTLTQPPPGKTQPSADPEENRAACLRRSTLPGDPRLRIFSVYPEGGMQRICYKAFNHADGKGSTVLPYIADVNGTTQRVERIEINGAKPAPSLFAIDYSLAKKITDETTGMDIEP